jgi:hypothetical protein
MLVQNQNNPLPQIAQLLGQALQTGALDPQSLMMLMQFLQSRSRGQAPNPMQRDALQQARGQLGPLFQQFIQSLMTGNVGQFMQQAAGAGGAQGNNALCGPPPPPCGCAPKAQPQQAQNDAWKNNVIKGTEKGGWLASHNGGYKKNKDGSIDILKGQHAGCKAVPTSKGEYRVEKDGQPVGVFKAPGGADKVASPLAFDLNGDGQINTKADGTKFDLTGKGGKTSGWVDKGDAMLAFDKNGDGKVGGDGSELFGNNTDLGTGEKYNNGFEALAGLEKKAASDQELGGKIKADGVLTADEIQVLENSKYKLRMKTDAGDGEGKKLSELGISQINTKGYQEAGQNADANGHQHRQVDKQGFVQNGQAKRVDDVWFKYT